MTFYLTLMLVGLAGLIMMALPGIGRHGRHALGGHGHGASGALHSHTGPAAIAAPRTAGPLVPRGARAAASTTNSANSPLASFNALRFVPSMRGVFTVLAFFGAFSYALMDSARLGAWEAGLIAILPAVLLDHFAVAPLWDYLFQFAGKPASPLTELVMTEATAVTPFRNGRGIVQVIHDGRMVQLSARISSRQASLPVRVGDQLKIEDVDEEKERVTVSLE